MIYGTVFHQMDSPYPFQDLCNVPAESVSFPTRAIYYPTEDGLRLARIETFSRPVFVPEGWEKRKAPSRPPEGDAEEQQERVHTADEAVLNARRAIRRAKQRAFDLIMCNEDMNLFATLTYSPERVADKADYQECYRYLNTFLSNRVQRRGLKYVCAVERTKAGDIHFHMICNAAAFHLTPAYSPYTGKPLKHGNKPLYNLIEWQRGFSSAEYITDREADGSARERVAKYIFKYIGKDMDSKIGGRYLLTGGAFVHPVVVHGESRAEFSTELPTTYQKRVDMPDIGVHYEADYYI